MTTVTLSRPIQAHGEERKEIELREPNGGDIAACGFPFTFSADGAQQTVNAAAIGALISRLGNIPPSSVNSLSFTDWAECMGAIFNFFGQSAQQAASSNGALTSPGSGSSTRERRSA